MLWVKVFHIMMVIAWLAGLIYLPRIFAQYAEGMRLGEDVRRLGVMANKLFKFMTLMAIQALVAGCWLWIGYGLTGEWLYAKMLFVLGILLYQIVCWYYLKKLLSGVIDFSGRQLKYLGQMPILLLLPILILGVVKPF